jgi:hypothetical protein
MTKGSQTAALVRSMLKSVGVGDKVDFTVEDDNGNEVITELKKSPAAP